MLIVCIFMDPVLERLFAVFSIVVFSIVGCCMQSGLDLAHVWLVCIIDNIGGGVGPPYSATKVACIIVDSLLIRLLVPINMRT